MSSGSNNFSTTTTSTTNAEKIYETIAMETSGYESKRLLCMILGVEFLFETFPPILQCYSDASYQQDTRTCRVCYPQFMAKTDGFAWIQCYFLYAGPIHGFLWMSWSQKVTLQYYT